MTYSVISTDNHINEPPGTFVDRVPADLKDKAPRIMRGADGGDGWSFDGKPPERTFGLNAIGAIAKQNYSEFKETGVKWEEIPPGNYDGDAQIKDNQLDGIDAATIYPGFAVGTAYNLADRILAQACIRAYNDWLLEDFCSADPTKLFALPFMPVNDGIPALITEAKRVVEKGAKGLLLPIPDIGYHDPQYDPLWEVAIDAHVPVTIHRIGATRQQDPGPMATGPTVAGIVQRFYLAINPISNMIFAGVFDRFPELAFIAAEVNCSWVPSVAQQMDLEYERQRHWANISLESQPSSYFGKNVFVTMLEDFVGCQLAKDDPVLANTTMFSTDYPHSATLWPNSKEFIAKMTKGMSAATKQKVLSGNAMRAYSLN